MTLDPTALFNITYGLYVLTAFDGQRDCGCITNSIMQLTDTPLRIAVSLNKGNHTADAIRRDGRLNVSVLSEKAPFSIFTRFGFQSGRDVDKFAGSDEPFSANGLRYLPEVSNTLVSARVEQEVDCGTHVLFICEVTQAEKLSADPSMTYSYYHANVKPKKKAEEKPKRGYVCRICGYFHEGEELPEDFICPLCKHGAADFEPVGF